MAGASYQTREANPLWNQSHLIEKGQFTNVTTYTYRRQREH